MLETSFQESFPPFPWSTPGQPQERGFNAGQTQVKLGRLSRISQTSTPQFPRLEPSRYFSSFPSHETPHAPQPNPQSFLTPKNN